MKEKPKLLGREAIRRNFPEAERAAQFVAQSIGYRLPEGYGFALLVFSFGEAGYLTHVSNCERTDLVKILRECADVLDRNADSPPGVVGQRD